MSTYHETYCKVYEKCKSARDADKFYIEVRMYKDSYRLYALKQRHGFACFAHDTRSIIPWVAAITNYIARKGWCDLPIPAPDQSAPALDNGAEGVTLLLRASA